MSVAHAPNRNAAFAEALVSELVRCGVRNACVSPGSRSAPLAIAAADAGGLRCFTPVDERASGFFALGMAKALREPVLLVCTSGSAATHYGPAVVEAHHAGVPLLVLTADRPPELREWGAGQTIDQQRLFGTHVRWFAETALPERGPALLRYARALACRAADAATATPPGPVHLNMPFREPLDPRPVAADALEGEAADPGVAGRGDRPYTRVRHGLATPSPDAVASLADRMSACRRGLVACGPLDATDDTAAAIASLASRLDWPLLAEPASQLRSGPHTRDTLVLGAGDWILRDADFRAAHRPDFVLRFGAAPTSKAFRRWLEASPPESLVLVDPARRWHDPSHLASDVFCADERRLCSLLERRLGAGGAPRSRWSADFAAAQARAETAIEAALDGDALVEPRIVRAIAAALPEGAQLYVGNSMPIRDVDGFWPVSAAPLRVLVNRGTNGIDGNLASAAGAAVARGTPTLLLTGDLAFLHDLSGALWASQVDAPLVVVVVDNDGGGIFSQLPVADLIDGSRFERLFRTPHGRDLVPLAAALGARTERVTSVAHLSAALKEALARPGFQLLLVPTERDANVALRGEVAAAVAQAIA
ncbi:MAG: 2-succinyl-5-enolpyruvyl-6-hydroxy-3-cyclohexene-1-carboxylic-acid synthase [Myxococcota bacterium]